MANIVDEIRDVELRGFTGYNLSELLFFISELDRSFKEELYYSWYHIILKCLLRKVKISYNEGGNSILFFMQDIRPQNKITYESVSNLISNKSEIFYEEVLSFSFKYFFHLLTNVWSWNRTLKQTPLNTRQKLVLLNELIAVKRLDYYTNRIDIEKFNLLVVFYDAQTEGNFLVQKCKRIGVKTATLSHGIVLAERDMAKLDYSGVELKGTNSDYFLAWNNFSLREAIKQGVPKQKVKVLGIPQFVNSQQIKVKVENKEFGLVLENRSGDEFNRKMIIIANTIAKNLGYKYTIRFHPTFKGNEYNDIINRLYYLGKNDDIKVFDYAKKLEFSIVANSTVFIELVYLQHRVYRFATNTIHDKYRDFKYNSFTSPVELQTLIINNIDESAELFKELCTVKNIGASYSKFFSKFK